MRRRVLPLLLIASLLPVGTGTASAGTSGGGDGSFQALGCYQDPVGDAGSDAAADFADLREVCINHNREQDLVGVVIDTVANQSPTTDPAWLNPQTGAVVGISTDADEEIERLLVVVRQDDQLVAEVVDGDGEPVCGAQTLVSGGLLLLRFPRTCIDEASPIRVAATMSYEPEAGAAVAVDRLPDDGLTLPLPDDRDESPVCANATERGSGTLTIVRLACGTGGTEPVSQAVATSQFVFDDPSTAVIDPYSADWAVIARDDDFADALAGSSLSFGQGPLLFTYSPRSAERLGRDPAQLADITRAELLRTLPRGRTVYLLGGTAALSDGLDEQLADLGYAVERFAGGGREETAALVAMEVSRLVEDFSAQTGFPDLNAVLITTGGNWPDAVVAGSVGSFWGMPILLTNVDSVHPATLAALDQLRPDYIHAIGGTSVISSATGSSIANHARDNGYGVGRQGENLESGPWKGFTANCFICRWPGGNRIETAAAVTQLNRDLVGRFAPLTPLIPENPQQYAVAVSLGVRCGAPQPDGSCLPEDQDPSFPYTLAAATVSGRFGGAVFIPTDNGTLNPTTSRQLCTTPGAEGFIEQVEDLVVVGDTDLLGDAFIDQVGQLAQDGCPPPQ